jgi:hypothetical protein
MGIRRNLDNRSVLGGARTARPLNDTFPRRPHGLTGPPRGTLVAEAPRTKKPPKSKTNPKVAGREISVIASFKNPWTEADEVKAMKENRWEPTSTDFQAVANDAILVDHWHKLIGAILTKGDAESAPGSIRRINIFTHANANLIAFAGHVRPGGAMTSVGLTVDGAISEDMLDELNKGITFQVQSKSKALAAKKFTIDDVRKRFTKDAVIVLYACHTAVDGAFVQRIADTFQVKVRGFTDVIGYFPSYEEADEAKKTAAKVTNRRRVGIGHNSQNKVTDFHELDANPNAVERSPRAPARAAAAGADDDE